MANRISVASQAFPPSGLPGVLAPSFAQAITADGDVVDTGRVMLVVNNTDSVAWTVTAVSTATVLGLTVSNFVEVVAAGKVALVGPFAASLCGQPAGANASGGNDQGRVYVNYTSSGGTLANLKRAAVNY
jgi:hypothetical protein